MKNINSKKDPIAKVRKHPFFKEYKKEARARILLATEVYNARVEKGISQQELARKSKTTQKVISKIENGQVNVGLDLVFKIIKSLNLKLQIGRANLL